MKVKASKRMLRDEGLGKKKNNNNNNKEGNFKKKKKKAKSAF